MEGSSRVLGLLYGIPYHPEYDMWGTKGSPRNRSWGKTKKNPM